MNCPGCGVEADGKFCGHCGTKIEPAVMLVKRSVDSMFVVRVPGPHREGTRIVVAPNDSFHGFRHGAVAVSFEKGEHALEEEIETGHFVRRDGLEIPFEEHLGIFEDSRGEKHEVAMRGTARLRVDEPADFVTRIDAEPFDASAVSAQVRSKLKELVDEEIRQLLAKGRYFTTLHSKKAIDEMRSEIRSKYAGDASRDPATSIEIEKLQIGSEAIATEPAVAAPEPPSSGFAAGARVVATSPDGRKFTGVVVGTFCRVAFEGAEDQWIPIEALVSADS